MTRVLRAVMLAASLVAPAAPAAAQAGTEEVLQQARALYERLEIERALPLFRQVISPAWPFEITDAQRVEAYKYLGAALTLAGKRDSAVLYFRAALERDAFTDLDAGAFTPTQVAAFGAARRLTFSVGARPVVERRVDPRTERVTFTVVTTHAATLRATVRASGAAGAVTLVDAASEGIRDVAWDGLGPDGRLAPPGRYEFLAVGRSRLATQSDSTRVFFDLRHDIEPLEDTLPPLAPGDLLPERHAESAAGRDLVKALGVAAGALLISGILSDDRLGAGSEGRIVAGGAVVVGLAAFLHRRGHREIPPHVAANEPRRAARSTANDAIRQRNAERVARTKLVIVPAAGIADGPPQ